MQTFKKTLIESINRDRKRQMSSILLPWYIEKFKKTPKDYYATILLKDGSRATVAAKRQKDILNYFADTGSAVLECICTW